MVRKLEKELQKEKQKNEKYYNNPNAFVQSLKEQKKQDRAFKNIDFAEDIADHILRNPDELDHQRASTDQSYILHRMFDFSTKTQKLDSDFILSNLGYIMDIDRKSGSGLKNSLEHLQRMSIRKLKEQEQREQRIHKQKQRKQNEEQEPRRKRGFRR